MLRRLPLLRLSAPPRRRRNPDEPMAPANVPGGKWKSTLEQTKVQVYGYLRDAAQALISAGVDGAALPPPLDLRNHAAKFTLLWASSQYPDLQAQSRLMTPEAKIVDALFSPFDMPSVLSFAAATSVLNKAKGAALENLNSQRQKALDKIAIGAERVKEGFEDKIATLLAKDTEAGAATAVEPQGPAELREDLKGWTPAALRKEGKKLGYDPTELENMSKADLVQALVEAAFPADDDDGDDDDDDDDDDDGDDLDPDEEDFDADDAEADEVPEPPKARRTGGKTASPGVPRARAPRGVRSEEKAEEPEAERSSPKGGRVGFERDQFLTRTRVTARNDAGYVPPSPEVMAEAKSDILLYLLKRGITQVWIKGALTVSFTSSQGRSSWMIAKGYAKDWLEETNEAGALKKSRFNTRILYASEEEPLGFDVIVQSRAERESAKQGKVPSREAVLAQLRGEGKRANPRGARTHSLRSARSRAVVAELRSSFRRNGYAVPVLAALGGFVAGTYAEAEYGLSKHFTRGGKATVQAVSAVRSGKLPALPSRQVASFEPSPRLVRMFRDFYALEEKKKRVPFAQAAKREAMEDRLNEMWAEVMALETQEKAGFRGNPFSEPVLDDEDLQRRWLAEVKKVGPMYPGMTFLRTVVRPTYPGSDNKEVVVIFRGSDVGASRAGRRVQSEWLERLSAAAAPLLRECGWRRSFTVNTR